MAKLSKWTTQDGNEILVKDMTNDHIANCIRYLEKRLKSGNTTIIIGEPPDWGDPDGGWWDYEDITPRLKKWIKIFKTEQKRRLPLGVGEWLPQ